MRMKEKKGERRKRERGRKKWQDGSFKLLLDEAVQHKEDDGAV